MNKQFSRAEATCTYVAGLELSIWLRFTVYWTEKIQDHEHCWWSYKKDQINGWHLFHDKQLKKVGEGRKEEKKRAGRPRQMRGDWLLEKENMNYDQINYKYRRQSDMVLTNNGPTSMEEKWHIQRKYQYKETNLCHLFCIWSTVLFYRRKMEGILCNWLNAQCKNYYSQWLYRLRMSIFHFIHAAYMSMKQCCNISMLAELADQSNN